MCIFVNNQDFPSRLQDSPKAKVSGSGWVRRFHVGEEFNMQPPKSGMWRESFT